MEMLSESELPMKTIFRQVGAKIAYYRTLREISQEELATKLNVEEKVLVGMEQGKYRRKFSLAIFQREQFEKATAELFAHRKDLIDDCFKTLDSAISIENVNQASVALDTLAQEFNG